MTDERFIEIFDETESNWARQSGDLVFGGLLIMSKYLPSEVSTLIQGADHDVVWGPNIEELVKAGITEEDTIKLRELGWMVEDETYLAHYV